MIKSDRRTILLVPLIKDRRSPKIVLSKKSSKTAASSSEVFSMKEFFSDPPPVSTLLLLKSFTIHFHFSLIFCPVISIASQEMLVWNIKLFPYFLTVWPPLTGRRAEIVFHLFHPKQNKTKSPIALLP